MTYLSRLLAAAVTLALSSADAYAAPTEADRAIAVRLVVEGRARFDAAQYSAALELFKRAHEIMRAPTTGLDLAKTHEALGQLVEARRIADEVANLPVEPNEKPIFAQARADAKLAIEALDSRIPLLNVNVIGPSVDVARIEIDGQAIPPEEAKKPFGVNPGKHTVAATAPGYHRAETTITLEESAKPLSVGLMLRPVYALTPPAKQEAGFATEAKVGFAIAGGLGVVAIGTGIGAIAMYGPAKNAFLANDNGQYEQLRRPLEGLTWTATISGALGIGALVFAVTRPRHGDATKSPPRAGLMITPTVGGAVVSGAW